MNKLEIKRLAYYIECLANDNEFNNKQTLTSLRYLCKSYLLGKKKPTKLITNVIMEVLKYLEENADLHPTLRGLGLTNKIGQLDAMLGSFTYENEEERERWWSLKKEIGERWVKTRDVEEAG